MEAKGKAKQLIDKMRVEISSMASKYEAKQCALITVDEIISNQYDYTPKAFDNYWKEVRNEIEKL